MYEPQNFDHLLGLKGFSDNALKIHFVLYQGYVTNANKLSESLKKMADEEKSGMPEWNELKRRFGWEFNGMRLHEQYFGGLTKNFEPPAPESKLVKKINEDFGSYENWERDFRSTAGMRGIGWAILCLDRAANRLFNVWVNEHDQGHLAGEVPLLPLDVFEHAFMLDYGTKRLEYIEAFLKAVDWEKVNERLEKSA